jgi:hypothetical protein
MLRDRVTFSSFSPSSPGAIGAAAGGGAARGYVSAAAGALDQVLGLANARLLRLPAALQLLTKRALHGLDAPEIAQAHPDHDDEEEKDDKFAHGESKHAPV